MNNSKKVIISFSGGRTSAYMAYKMQFSPEFSEWEKHYVFANTGKEREETLDFVQRCDKEFGLNLNWIEGVINQEKGVGVDWRRVDFLTASRKGEPFHEMVLKFGVPNKDYPHCTRELKTRPMQKWADDTIGREHLWAIGFRVDERKRIGGSNDQIYPLVTTWPTNERMVREFWAGMPFDLQLKDYQGNCDLCWKKSMIKRLTIIAENPSVADQWQAWEETDEYVFDRDGYSIKMLKTMSKRPFRHAKDKHELRQLFPELHGIDILCESACTCT